MLCKLMAALSFLFCHHELNAQKATIKSSLSALTARTISFDNGWLFTRDSVTDAEQANYNDGKWRKVDLPHDWSIEDLPGQSDSVVGPFSTKSIGATATGYTVGGTGWYRKHFTLDFTNHPQYKFNSFIACHLQLFLSLRLNLKAVFTLFSLSC